MPDSRRLSGRGTTTLMAVTAAVLLATALRGGLPRRASAVPSTLVTTLGDTLPDVTLATITGARRALRHQVGSRAAVIYIFSPKECASCSSLPIEFDVIRRTVPGVRPLLVASGTDTAELARYIRLNGLGDDALLDPERQLIRAWRGAEEPLVILVARGRIVLEDRRSAARAAHYPIGRILADLASATKPADR